MERDLAKRAIAGDERALLKLLEQHEETLYRTAYAYLKNEHDAVEAIQELTYRALKKIHTVKEPMYIATWLVRIIINICLDMKKKQGEFVYDHNVEIASTDHQPFEMADIIASLPIEQQELVYLKYFQDMKNGDIAQLKQIPEGTVKSRLHTTLKRLRVLIEKEEL
ncbi:sigma-70 family RNA polymerase sigma factor [Sporosarcina sp. ANT_H38]|uniref:sigma-70 family RNA polymerase sigma factor n=1 Tax=Sporosarcina sp. ANT_H38 TaxID=2597358 RepID=UPI0011F2F66E|nr:sigma-70 family RNA polymerase sigma factor [Sporosarcina sp. ANT_H38]KAA0965769.1 sigma-70 family RNA polymerase sigma factor [Sporosarcina sp. ANT_H38]